MKHPEHFCSNTDGDCVCTCYADGYAKGVEAAKRALKECDCPPEPDFSRALSGEHVDTLLRYVGRFNYNKAIKDSRAALNELTDKS